MAAPGPSFVPSRSCLLIADAVVGDHRGEEYAAEVGQGVLVVAGGDAAPVFEAVEAALDGVAVAEVSASMAGGRPPSDPFALRWVIWSERSGMVCGIFNARSLSRVEEWA
jgi:hypothetical protein